VSRAFVPLLFWATLLTVLAAVLWVWSSDHFPAAIFSAAAGVAWLVGFYAVLRPGKRPRLRFRPELDLSFSSVLVALAVAMLVLGALVGEWLILIGAGVLVAGLIGVARELRAERRYR
jgi:O-antigen/teichoic acid export membrane protein